MGTPIPAVCLTPKCNTVFYTTNAFSIPPGVTGYLGECQVGPCPKCRGMGLIPSGQYGNFDGKTHYWPETPADRDLLQNALGLVRDAINTQMPVEAFQQTAAARFPELSPLWKLLPKTQQDAYQFWLLVIGTITFLLMAYSTFRNNPPQELVLPSEVIEALRESLKR